MSQNISKDDILKIALLARLHLSNRELDKFYLEISDILNYVKILDSVNIEKLEPTNQVNGLENIWREDKIKSYKYSSSKLMENVKDQESGYIKVERVI